MSTKKDFLKKVYINDGEVTLGYLIAFYIENYSHLLETESSEAIGLITADISQEARGTTILDMLVPTDLTEVLRKMKGST